MAADAKKTLSTRAGSVAALVIAALWTLPTFGLFISSLRPEAEIKGNGWWNVFVDPKFTLENYQKVLTSSSDSNLGTFFINSFVITIPAVLIPICLATLAAYAFAWMDFKGRDTLFVAVFALQIVPIQITMIPLLSMYTQTSLGGRFAPAGGFWAVWLSHSIFALPLAIFLLHNFMREIPGELIESARVDGAGHVQIFTKIMLPLMAPAIAAFGIFQFLWVWNDLLVALVFSGGNPGVAPLTVQLAQLAGQRGEDWHLLSAGAFVSLIVPLTVFLALQRYFVRGLMAGSVKG
ncbi:MAG TPA: carbohydrate ABC transporter permease [Marmoricola sp.]|nr:carbohydrate ABC transporter permease [Marmoricola sp.]